MDAVLRKNSGRGEGKATLSRLGGPTHSLVVKVCRDTIGLASGVVSVDDDHLASFQIPGIRAWPTLG